MKRIVAGVVLLAVVWLLWKSADATSGPQGKIVAATLSPTNARDELYEVCLGKRREVRLARDPYTRSVNVYQAEGKQIRVEITLEDIRNHYWPWAPVVVPAGTKLTLTGSCEGERLVFAARGLADEFMPRFMRQPF